MCRWQEAGAQRCRPPAVLQQLPGLLPSLSLFPLAPSTRWVRHILPNYGPGYGDGSASFPRPSLGAESRRTKTAQDPEGTTLPPTLRACKVPCCPQATERAPWRALDWPLLTSPGPSPEDSTRHVPRSVLLACARLRGFVRGIRSPRQVLLLRCLAKSDLPTLAAPCKRDFLRQVSPAPPGSSWRGLLVGGTWPAPPTPRTVPGMLWAPDDVS